MTILDKAYNDSLKMLEKPLFESNKKNKQVQEMHSKYDLREIKDPVRCFYCEWLPVDTPEKRKFKADNKYYIILQSHTPLNPSGLGIFFRKSTDGGQTLDDTTDLTNKIVISNPGYVLASNGNHICVIGPEYGFKDGNHMVFSQSSDGGILFSNSIDFDQNSMSTVPEFPFAIPVLLIGITSLIVFSRLKIHI